ncbi:MAG: type VI secretion system tip protein TssI/VgrG [Nibricoccus sp.]
MITQDNRPIAITTPFGKDKLLLRSFTYAEALNGDFEIQASLVATDQTLAYDKVVGQPVSLRMTLDKGSNPRRFHGIVASIQQQGRESNLAHYSVTILPWFKFLDQTADCKIFQNESVPDIIAKVFKAHGFSDFEKQLTESYKPLEFCVQYRESAWNFVSRLMEKEGIGYHFKHEENRHLMVLTDSVSKHKAIPGYETIPYRESDTAGQILGAISSWEVKRTALTGTYAHTDFDFKKPSTSLLASVPLARQHGMAKFEVFDYPGAYVEQSDGERLAKMHIQELQHVHDVLKGRSTARGLCVGALFSLKDHPRADQNREYLITSVRLSFDAGAFSGAHIGSKGHDLPETFSCSFEAIPSDQPYRPARIAKKHMVVGPQTAIVTGPSGEEIHTDEHGRVKVHFHWDRYGKFDADSSCWIRVSQYWAGKGWGAMHIPRIGQEVIVEFLDGDPDRPIITGRVYNGEQKPPYALPGNKNISTLTSRSTKGGAADNFNEVKMDDSKGKELLYIQAEKDRTVLVKNDNTETVKHDEKIEIGNDRTAKVKKNESLTIGENETIGIGKKLSLKVGEEISIVCGAASITMKKDGKIEIAGVDVTTKSGAGKVNIDAGGIITIKGPMVKIN